MHRYLIEQASNNDRKFEYCLCILIYARELVGLNARDSRLKLARDVGKCGGLGGTGRDCEDGMGCGGAERDCKVLR